MTCVRLKMANIDHRLSITFLYLIGDLYLSLSPWKRLSYVQEVRKHVKEEGNHETVALPISSIAYSSHIYLSLLSFSCRFDILCDFSLSIGIVFRFVGFCLFSTSFIRKIASLLVFSLPLRCAPEFPFLLFHFSEFRLLSQSDIFVWTTLWVSSLDFVTWISLDFSPSFSFFLHEFLVSLCSFSYDFPALFCMLSLFSCSELSKSCCIFDKHRSVSNFPRSFLIFPRSFVSSVSPESLFSFIWILLSPHQLLPFQVQCFFAFCFKFLSFHSKFFLIFSFKSSIHLFHVSPIFLFFLWVSPFWFLLLLFRAFLASFYLFSVLSSHKQMWSSCAESVFFS